MPVYSYLLSVFVYVFASCNDEIKTVETSSNVKLKSIEVKDIRSIPLPTGFNYIFKQDSIYSNWLLNLKFKADRTIYLHDGSARSNQFVQFGVLDIAIGKKDLVQCADAAIKLRADYLLSRQQYDQLIFTATSGDEISFDKWLKGTRWKERAGRLVAYNVNNQPINLSKEYNSFMEIVYAYCGTYSLSKQLKTVKDIDSIQPGNVFVEGGFPGHAVTVMAVAENSDGKRIFLLSQGYMPAQDFHLLKNYTDPGLSPWYEVADIYPLYTPEWQFGSGSLRRW